MSVEIYRSMFAIIGLVLGMLLMVGLGFGGLIPGFLFGAGGAVLGGMAGERIANKRTRP